MLLKTAILFLAAMVVIGMIGSKFFPGAIPRRLKGGKSRPRHPVCPRCGRYLIGKDGCGCKTKG